MATRGFGRVLAINFGVLMAVWIAGDFALTLWKPPPADPEKEYRIFEPLYSHTLRANYSTNLAVWGNSRYPVRTNSLGFRDGTVRTVSKVSDKPRRLVFIGDSFTEAVGLAWEDSFVGMFAQRAPEFEVLNAGLASYGASVYYRKIAWLLDQGYRFDELLVYIDVSDVQDEAVVYHEDANGSILYNGYAINYLATLADPEWRLPAPVPRVGEDAPRGVKDWLRSHFAYSNLLYSIVKAKLRDQGEPPKKLLRSFWTIDPNIPGYGDMGVEGGIRKAVSYMDRLRAMLAARNIAMSVAVYPWPDQIEFDREDSRQVSLWKGWCERNGCTHFINHFPDFFAYKREHPDWRRRLFIPGDVHHSRAASELIAQRLLTTYGVKGATPASTRPRPQ
jgi:hypothetical protein